MSEETGKPGWATALGKIPSGLFILTIAGPQGETGMLASWIQQCSFDPPMMTIAFGNGRPVVSWLAEGLAIGVNIVSEGSKALVAHFGKGFAPGDLAFEGVEVIFTPAAAPRLTAALAWLDTRVQSWHEFGDHTIAVVRIVDGLVMHEGRPTVHIRRDGSRY
jgi:flavin reductase (DIM6/NTAB) family NADH-FMN oxidoreductase RutF